MRRFLSVFIAALLFGLSAGRAFAALEETIANRISAYASRPMELASNSEAQAASDLARFYGYDLSALEILSLLPTSDDPTVGFVGDPREKPALPPGSYGVYPGPIAETLSLAGIPAVAAADWSIEDLKAAVGAGHPVICWVVGNTAPGKGVPYRSESGNEIVVVDKMNTVTVDGFNDLGFSVWDNGENYFRTFVDFETSWKVLGHMTLRIDAAPVSKPAGTAIPLIAADEDDDPFTGGGLTAVAPSPSGAWWNEGEDDASQASKKAFETTGASPWLDEPFELFGELQEVQPVFEDNPALTLDGYETWFSVAGAPAYNSGSAYSIPANPWLDLDSQAAPGALPGAAAIDGFVGYAQSYNLDCETRSAVDLASYFGVRIDYMSFLTGLPKSDDPNEGFVGNYWDARGGLPPNGYGVYERPVAELLTSFGLPSFGVSNFNWEGIKEQVARGNPVMAWVVGNTTTGTPLSYTPASGIPTTVVPYQHTVVVLGYDEAAGTVTLQDGGMRYTRSIQTFLASWGVLGNRAVFRIG